LPLYKNEHLIVIDLVLFNRDGKSPIGAVS